MGSWLRCQASPGQLSGECAVKGELHDGRTFSLFAQRENLSLKGDLESKPVEALMKVRELKAQSNLSVVSLPHATFENGRVITVKSDSLVDKPFQ